MTVKTKIFGEEVVIETSKDMLNFISSTMQRAYDSINATDKMLYKDAVEIAEDIYRALEDTGYYKEVL